MKWMINIIVIDERLSGLCLHRVIWLSTHSYTDCNIKGNYEGKFRNVIFL